MGLWEYQINRTKVLHIPINRGNNTKRNPANKKQIAMIAGNELGLE